MKNLMTLFGLACVFAVTAIAAEVPAKDLVLGKWITEDRGIIEIVRSGESVEGTIIGGERPKDLDVKNPDEKLRSRPLVGLMILRGFNYDKDGRWVGGTIYDPNSGNTYDARMHVEETTPNEMKLRGYVLGIPFLGRTAKWTRQSVADAKAAEAAPAAAVSPAPTSEPAQASAPAQKAK